MPPFLALPTEIHLLVFEHLDSIHTLCLLIQTCKQLHAFWHHNALPICANRAAAKSHTDRGCELAISQQQSADARVPNWEQTPRDSDEEEQREQANKEIAGRVIRNNALVYQAGERLISQLREEAADGHIWAGMLRREGRSEEARHPVGKGFRAEMARMTLSVGERRRFEDAYYGFWIGAGVEDVKGGGGKVMRHGELDLRSLFLGKVMLRGRGG